MTSRLFDPLPKAERSAAADQATLAAARAIDSSLTIERKEPTSRLGDVTGKVAGKVVNLAFRATYRELAHDAAHKASERLSGALTWSQRHAGAVAPATATRPNTTNAASSANRLARPRTTAAAPSRATDQLPTRTACTRHRCRSAKAP